MDYEIIIPDECVKYIRYQRSKLNASRVPNDEDVKRLHAEWVRRDFDGMEPFLPEKVDTILEIGCGMAALQVLLHRKYPDAKIRLLDGDKVTREGGGGYDKNPDVYNSRRHTEMLLAANGVKVDRWYPLNTKQVLTADLIISTASMGYHYPVSTYRLNGTVIADLRRCSEELRGELIFVGPKYDRRIFKMGA